MTKYKKEYYFILLVLIIVLSQLYRIIIFENFTCNTSSNSCKTIQTNIFGAKNIINISNYSDLDSVTYESSHTVSFPVMSYYRLDAITKYDEHRLISTKRFYDFQNYSNIIMYLNDKISKHENFNYRFWGLSNTYKFFI